MKYRRDGVEENSHRICSDDVHSVLVDVVLREVHTQNIADQYFEH